MQIGNNRQKLYVCFMKIETIAIHAGNERDQSTGAVIQPIVLSTTFERHEDGSYTNGYIYGRSSNPNRTSLEHVCCGIFIRQRGGYGGFPIIKTGYSCYFTG